MKQHNRFTGVESMMLFNPLVLIVILVCAFFFYCAGRFEGTSGLAWAGLSIAISVVIRGWLHGSVIFLLMGQLGLYAGITTFLARRKP